MAGAGPPCPVLGTFTKPFPDPGWQVVLSPEQEAAIKMRTEPACELIAVVPDTPEYWSRREQPFHLACRLLPLLPFLGRRSRPPLPLIPNPPPFASSLSVGPRAKDTHIASTLPSTLLHRLALMGCPVHPQTAEAGSEMGPYAGGCSLSNGAGSTWRRRRRSWCHRWQT